MTARAHRRQTRDPQRNRQKAHPTKVTTLKATGKARNNAWQSDVLQFVTYTILLVISHNYVSTVAAMIQKTARLEVTAARNPHQSL
jgi:hypothetical protein